MEFQNGVGCIFDTFEAQKYSFTTKNFKHIAIEVDHPTIIKINDKLFQIGFQCMLEYEDAEISSIEFTQQIQALITYEI